VIADIIADPAGLLENVVRRRFALGYELFARVSWKWQVHQHVAVHVPHLPAVDAEFYAAKAVIVHRHPGPA
jgi:hypothetical protein